MWMNALLMWTMNFVVNTLPASTLLEAILVAVMEKNNAWVYNTQY